MTSNFIREKADRLQGELKVAERLAREAGALILSYLSGPLEVGHKEHDEVVTPADREANNLILTGLKNAFPDDAIYSEEIADSPKRLSHSRVWIVDPLDGTSNFIDLGDEFSVSIGLSVEGRAVLGVVYNPRRDELFAGGLGLGVSLNGATVKVNDAEDLSGARLLVSRKEWRRGLTQIIPSPPLIPVASMAYKLARVAAGLEDGVFSKKPRKEWGICAGAALVLAAGGKATLLNGEEIRFNRAELKQPLGFVAAGPKLHPLLLKAAQAFTAEGVT
ncbi:MAG: 3'(2'),5'-bisphosphate nucleotidase CysQ [Nitrospirae bacterium]|nr:3'(2'),5'-bisphosphate nucleotidase CysQ [Nitrospirota bacterium]